MQLIYSFKSYYKHYLSVTGCS